jgi:hypothetical protein
MNFWEDKVQGNDLPAGEGKNNKPRMYLKSILDCSAPRSWNESDPL